MKILLDTCTFLWSIAEPKKLSKTAKAQLEDPDNEIYFSAISAWEISIQQSLGRLKLPEGNDNYITEQRIRHDFLSLPLEEQPSSYLRRLPQHHRDPFDRMLICQALYHALTILTPDQEIAKYPVKILWK